MWYISDFRVLVVLYICLRLGEILGSEGIVVNVSSFVLCKGGYWDGKIKRVEFVISLGFF